MDRIEFVKRVDEKLKVIRSEFDFTQDKMAEIIGISKKTLVQIEKGRASLGWSGAIAVCTIFRDSEIIEMIFGGQPQDLILTIAFNSYDRSCMRTMGGRIWWKDIESSGTYKIQQNITTNHFRILDKENRRVCASFDVDYINKRYEELMSI